MVAASVEYGCSLFYIRLQVATELLRYSTVAGPAGTLAAPAAEVAYLPDHLLSYSYLLYSYLLDYLLCPGGGGAAGAQLLGGKDAGQHAH